MSVKREEITVNSDKDVRLYTRQISDEEEAKGVWGKITYASNSRREGAQFLEFHEHTTELARTDHGLG